MGNFWGASLIRNVNQTDDDVQLRIACRNDDTTMVKLLLDMGARIKLNNPFGVSPLHLACRYGSARVSSMLVHHGARIDAHDTVNGSTPLMLSCRYGHYLVVEVLLRNGAPVNDIDNMGANALHYACQNDHLCIASLLLDSGVDVNRATLQKITPLWIACNYGSRKMVEMLVNVGADPNIESDGYGTPLQAAIPTQEPYWKSNLALGYSTEIWMPRMPVERSWDDWCAIASVLYRRVSRPVRIWCPSDFNPKHLVVLWNHPVIVLGQVLYLELAGRAKLRAIRYNHREVKLEVAERFMNSTILRRVIEFMCYGGISYDLKRIVLRKVIINPSIMSDPVVDQTKVITAGVNNRVLYSGAISNASFALNANEALELYD